MSLATLGRKALARAVVALSLSSACSATRPGAADTDLARAGERSARGATLFSSGCARCHGDRGEGRADAPAVLGAQALPEFPREDSVAMGFSFQDPQELEIRQQTHAIRPPVRRPFRTAQDLHDFVAAHVRERRVESRKPEDTWAVVTFMIAAHGCPVPEDGVNAANAASTPVQRCRAASP